MGTVDIEPLIASDGKDHGVDRVYITTTDIANGGVAAKRVMCGYSGRTVESAGVGIIVKGLTESQISDIKKTVAERIAKVQSIDVNDVPPIHISTAPEIEKRKPKKRRVVKPKSKLILPGDIAQ
jgi:hypothetical protein